MSNEIVGLIPAAGLAKRLGNLPGSKELFPVGFREIKVDGRLELRAKMVSQYLLDNMMRAGAKKVWMVLGRNKEDILRYYGDGSEFGLRVAYLLMDNLWGMPYTLDQAWPWVQGQTVLFGMADTIFRPVDAFARMLAQHEGRSSDVTLGIFPTEHPERLCPVRLDDDMVSVKEMTDKPVHSEIKNTWGCACWSPAFSDFLHNYLATRPAQGEEVVLAAVFQAAIQQGFKVDGVLFEDGEYLDVGTPEELRLAVHRFSA